MTFSQRAVEAAADAIDEAIRKWQPGSPDRLKHMAAKAALTAAIAVDGVALQGWQPIESAPKDTSVLISDGTLVLEAKFVSEHGFWLDPYGECEDPWIGNAYTPIRWMPLPPPPAASDGEERE